MRIKSRFISAIAFARECCKNPRSMGTIWPSSRALAKRMAEKINSSGKGYIIELGAGTGRVTEALLARGISPRRLLVVERAEALADVLRRKFPGINIIHGEASRISTWLPKNAVIDSIVSSLPFASLSAEASVAIISEIKRHIGSGNLIQYTYLFHGDHILTDFGFNLVSSRMVWNNLPPAITLEFVLSGNGAKV